MTNAQKRFFCPLLMIAVFKCDFGGRGGKMNFVTVEEVFFGQLHKSQISWLLTFFLRLITQKIYFAVRNLRKFIINCFKILGDKMGIKRVVV